MGGGIGQITLAFLLSLGGGPQRIEELTQAQILYARAEEASTFFAQQHALEEALVSLLAIDTSRLAPDAAADIEMITGDIYAKRGQEALASLHYRRGLQRSPWNFPLQERLQGIIQRLDLPPDPFRFFLPMEFLHGFFFFSTLLFFVLLSLSIWVSIPFGRWCIGGVATLSALALIGLFFSRYLTPVEGVVITQVSQQKEKLQPGMKVAIVAVNETTKTFSITIDKKEILLVDQEVIGVI